MRHTCLDRGTSKILDKHAWRSLNKTSHNVSNYIWSLLSNKTILPMAPYPHYNHQRCDHFQPVSACMRKQELYTWIKIIRRDISSYVIVPKLSAIRGIRSLLCLLFTVFSCFFICRYIITRAIIKQPWSILPGCISARDWQNWPILKEPDVIVRKTMRTFLKH